MDPAQAVAFPAFARSLGASHITGTISSPARIADTGHLDYDEVVTSDQFVKTLDGRPVDVVVDPVGGVPLLRLAAARLARASQALPISGRAIAACSVTEQAIVRLNE